MKVSIIGSFRKYYDEIKDNWWNDWGEKSRKITEVLLIKNTTVCKVVLQQNLEFDKNQGKADKVIDKKYIIIYNCNN